MDLKRYLADDHRMGIVLVLLTAIISGFSIFINSFGVKEFDSSIFTFMKNSLVALMLFSIIYFAGNFSEIKLLKKWQWAQLAIIGLIGGSIPFLLYFRGLQSATGATSGFLHKTIFIFVAIFAIAFLKERLTKNLFIGAVLLLVGNYLILRPDFIFAKAHALILIAVIFWAAENTYSKHVLKGISGNIVAFGRMFFGSLFILGFLAATGKIILISRLTFSHLMWIALASIFLLAYVLSYYNGLKHIKVTTAACILSIGQPITLLLSYFFKGKAFTAMQGFGIILTVSGIISVIAFSEIISYVKKFLRPAGYGRN